MSPLASLFIASVTRRIGLLMFRLIENIAKRTPSTPAHSAAAVHTAMRKDSRVRNVRPAMGRVYAGGRAEAPAGHPAGTR